MPYDAFTLDTNTVIQGGLDFEAGLLAQLGQFKDGPTEFILSEIVIREILKHLQASTKKARDTAVSSILRAFSVGLIDDAARQAALDALKDSRAVARKRLAAFIAATGAEAVPAKLCNMEDLVKSYFENSAPFEPTGDKKHEFPDALALLSLQEWARSSGKTILAASSDNGWKAFAESSDHLFVEGELGSALQIVQLHTEAAGVAVQNLLSAVNSHELPDAEVSMNRLLSIALRDWDFNVEAESHLRFEVDETQLDFQSFQLLEQDGDYGVTIVRLAAEETVFQVEMEITAVAKVGFSLYIWDSIDREELSMGGSSATSEETFDSTVLITISGSIDGSINDLEITDIELIDGLDSADMGYIDIDYGDDGDEDYNQLQFMLDTSTDEVGFETGKEANDNAENK